MLQGGNSERKKGRQSCCTSDFAWLGKLCNRSTPRHPDGLDVLEERYARGEIKREEYLEKRKDILG